MRTRRFCGLIVLLVAASIGGRAIMGQSLMTTALRGRVLNDGAGLPGVTVTLTSPALQGTRTATTSASGDYSFAGIPPGDYTVTFALAGFQTVTKTIPLTATQPATQDAVISIAGVTTATVVTARAETVSTTTQASTTLTSDITNKLPVGRTIMASVELSSGLSRPFGFNNAATISGGQTFDNLFTVDGAVVMDNIRGTPNNLFVEDAIQEITTSVSSVSAEYGRFTGGVVNTVTKSGGNQFAGSFRTSLSNAAWSAVTPKNEVSEQKVNPVYEATLGGPIWKDRVWFFGSGRIQNLTTTGQTVSPTNISYPVGDDQKRYQGKVTVTPFGNQTLAVNYLKVTEEQSGNSFGSILDLASLVTRQLPQEILTANYNGVITSNFFVEGLYSRRKLTFENAGSLYTDVINGTLMRDLSNGRARYNAPTFCGVCDPEHRDNKDYYVKGTYFLSTSGLGSHNIVVGYDRYDGSRLANNYQSGSNYRMFTTGTIIQGGDIFPVIDSKSYIYYTPIDTLSKGTNALTHSVFLNDAWRVSDRLSVNLGVRWDKNDASDSRGVVTAKDSAFSPRLAAQFDVTGKGSANFGASYARYVGGLQDNLLDSASNAGRSSTFLWYYETVPGGPAATPINSPASSTLVTRAQALQQVFNWFFAQGCPNISTCKVPLAYASVAGLSSQIPAAGLTTPFANEYTFGSRGTVGRFSYRADFVRRDFKDSYYTLLNMSTGKATDLVGNKYDVGIQGNTNDLVRNYTALQTQFSYRAGRLALTANWTWSHTLGNSDGEAGNSGPTSSAFMAYPEYKDPAWNNPTGSLATDQRHRVRLFGSYDLPFIPEKIGAMSVGLVQGYDTGAPYGALGPVQSQLYVTNPGYITRPPSVTYYFTARDAFRTDDIKRTDLSLNFSTKIGGVVEIFLQPQVINVFNNHAKVGVDTTVQTAATTSGYLKFNPFTTTPVQGPRNTTTPTANWNYGPNFGNARSNLDFQQPRTFQATVGLRF